jgi:trehalose 6-phosphate synthase
VPPEQLVALHQAAGVMLVTPLRDGMDLVARESVASRIDEAAALVLSEFTGAAEPMDRARLVNPYDIGGMKRTILAAIRDPRSAIRDPRATGRDGGAEG